MATAVPNPLSPKLGVADIVLKGVAWMLNSSTRNDMICNVVTASMPITQFPLLGAAVIYSLDCVKPLFAAPSTFQAARR